MCETGLLANKVWAINKIEYQGDDGTLELLLWSKFDFTHFLRCVVRCFRFQFPASVNDARCFEARMDVMSEIVSNVANDGEVVLLVIFDQP